MPQLTTIQLTELITKYKKLVEWMAKSKADELSMRLTICNELESDIQVGRNKGVFNGIKYMIEKPQTVKVDKAALPAVLAKLPAQVNDKCIKREPELSKTEYNKLPDHLKKILDEALIIKDGTLKLEI